MGLTIYQAMDQRSPEWYEARRGMVTASTIGQLITAKTIRPADNPESRALTVQLVAERITGWVDDTYQSGDMIRGILDEPVARAAYSAQYAPAVECGFMVRELEGWRLGYSPDGLVGDDGLIEIKSRRPRDQVATVLADAVPAEHMAQIQAGLFVSGRDWCDYVSFAGGMPLYVKRVTRDTHWLDAIAAVMGAFEDAARQMLATYTARTSGLPSTERSYYDRDIEV